MIMVLRIAASILIILFAGCVFFALGPEMWKDMIDAVPKWKELLKRREK